ncbi:Modifier of rudimentary Modr [Penicillium cinerascens]|uniref:Modifier of rudimentary Modr n=1 Tax=Penicillium cinerascens TaxID=70096 RepID=A0A9W9T7W0_9EURO|nr:Modifier of rudimentary Modr [Penicillium cinerascens]KAJ5212569.1 Modifier of rudimentary Modr [Penicillium cinerascens]
MSQSASPYPTQSSFYSTPPMSNPALNADTPPPPPPKPISHEASRAQAAHQLEYHQTQPASLPAPPTIEEGWLPELVKDKSTIDLQTILKDPRLITALSNQHPSHTSRQEHLESLIQTNKDLVNRLLEMQTHVAELRGSTEKMLLTHQSLEVSWRKKQTEMDTALAPWSPKALYQRLSAAIAEQEAVCHAVEESFLDEDHHGRATEKEITDWVRRVRAEASKLAARKEAKARWDEGRVGGWR